MATLLADPPAPPDGQGEPSPPGGAAPAAGTSMLRSCTSCAAPLAPGQDWCLQCGAGTSDSLDGHRHRWRAPAAVVSALVLLVAGAAAAAYAAFGKSGHKARGPVLARVLTPAAPVTTTPAPTTLAPAPAVPKLKLPPTVKASKAPLVKATVPLSAKTGATTTTPASTTTTPSTGTSKSTTTPAEKQPAALTLDTNAASTYNPYSYSQSNFGDPSLAIDGEPRTAWTARVEAAVAPRLAEGLVLDLKSAQRLSALVLVTSTPGMTVQVYGAVGQAPPASITDPAWTRLSAALVAKKHTTRIAVSNGKRAVRFVTLWISKAPAGAMHVSVNELELFPAA